MKLKYKIKHYFKYVFNLNKLINDLISIKLLFYHYKCDISSAYPRIMMTKNIVWCPTNIKELSSERKDINASNIYKGGLINNYYMLKKIRKANKNET